MKSIGGIICYTAAPKLFFATRNNKFAKEKVNFEDEKFAVNFDGILLNNQELFKKDRCNNNCDLLIRLYKEYGNKMVFHAKGAYALSIWDKKQGTVLITNDLLSKRSIYYNFSDSGVCFAGSYHDLLDLLTKTDFCYNINLSAVNDMMNGGVVLGNKTYLKDVFYLNAFESIVVDLKNNNASLICHEIKKETLPATEDEMLKRFDTLFTEAVRLQFSKNAEYGYRQVATISGGMDSRACLLKGIQCGFKKDLFCFSYAQSGSLDFEISQQIATDYGLDYMFYPMDSALFVNRMNDTMACNECQQSPLGSTGANTVANLINTSQCGIINIGICGGELMGDLITAKGVPKGNLGRVVRLLKTDNAKLEYNPKDLLNHLRGCQNFAYMFLDRCEAISPFMDEDVFMFATQIKPEYMYRRKFYIKWMQKYIPNNYVVTHTCCPMNASALKIVLTKASFEVKKIFTKNSAKEMNPFDVWFENKEYKESFNKKYEQLCNQISGKVDADKVMEMASIKWSNNWRVNSYVLTALFAVLKVYNVFGD